MIRINWASFSVNSFNGWTQTVQALFVSVFLYHSSSDPLKIDYLSSAHYNSVWKYQTARDWCMVHPLNFVSNSWRRWVYVLFVFSLCFWGICEWGWSLNILPDKLCFETEITHAHTSEENRFLFGAHSMWYVRVCVFCFSSFFLSLSLCSPFHIQVATDKRVCNLYRV